MSDERTPAELERDLPELSVDELESLVKTHNYRYWIENEPTIPDPLFDQLVEQLRERSPDSPVLNAIGPEGAGEHADDRPSYGDKVEHDEPMLSLDKAYDEETVHKWFDGFEGDAVASPKIDGVACSLRYEAGQLALAATRGNGWRGEVITRNAQRVNDVPHRVDHSSRFEVRGEVYMPLSVFKDFAEQYANPRNLAAGAIKHKDPDHTARYGLRFFAYDLLDGSGAETEVDKFARLREMGFRPVDYTLAEREHIQEYYDSIVARRDRVDYEMDGVVFRANRIDEQERLGQTSHHPRYAIAYKFQGESGTSRLVDVEWSVSRSGTINPVAVVEPVTLSGATVTRASLHNLGFIESLGLRTGSTVMMTRRGGVIPHVEKVVELGDGEIEVPDHCPSCGHSPTERRGDFLYCSNLEACGQVQLTLLKHFVDAIEIKGFGPRIIERLYETSALQSPADFYRLELEALLTIERMGETLAQKLLDEVDAHRTIPLDAFLRSLAIPDLGRVASRDLANHFGSLETIREASVEDIAAIHGLGELTGESIHGGLRDRAAIIDDLLDEVTVETVDVEEAATEPTGPLAGRSFLFTGALESMKRKEAQERVRELGGETPSGVVRGLDYLVIGDADLERFEAGWRSSKLKKAERYNEDGSNIEIVGESRFLEMIE